LLDIDWVALRLVLTYGPGVRGNVARLVQLSRSFLPLPFAGLKARRSLLSLDNLVAAIECVLTAQQPLRRPLIVADHDALTIPTMIATMRSALNRSAGLFWIPQSVLKSAFWAARRADLYQRLAEPLVADSSALQSVGWSPPVTTPDGLRRLVQSEAARPA
jgi:UDP-glucose 4-epimerase